MTHQPPIPKAAQSSYPRHPAPHNDGAIAPTPRAPAAKPDALPVAQLLSIGAAVIGSAALAAWYYARSAPPSPARKSADRKRIASTQAYEVTYFARKHGLTAKDARAVLAEAGTSRARANALAKERAG